MANGNRSAERKLVDYEFMGCRLRRHQWEEKGKYLLKVERDKYVVFRYACLTCTAERTDIFDKNGELDERRYKMPRGYGFHYTEAERAANQRVTTRTVARFLIRQHLRDGDLPELEEEE